MTWNLDELDRYIVYCLQEDARNVSSGTIAERMGVSASTVRNRIHRLEDDGIITEYNARVDFEAAGSQLHTLIVCTAPIPERSRLAKEALAVDGVVDVREVMTGEENVHVGIVGTDSNDLNRIGEELDELGLEVNDEDLIRAEYTTPYSGFDVAPEEE
ncbi:Lrp/AsnC family transcriptional regulator [Halapricum salinum]|uniref:Lrp/AsnC family transcriptional regulator n=1 Tax=Halapricum salinum TaxID=1457250 RepID=A0A4D6HF05_9EURY|nr:Lrp/AsnC family transcriptional regulator [Halapricum salinum]QCC51317.1 Lrp/AsnC family transcriptional regulator [Halapricum salinum]